MKQLVSILLMIGLIFTGFVGCSKDAVTPTEVFNADDTSVASTNETVSESNVADGQDTNPSALTSSEKDKTDVNVTSSKATVPTEKANGSKSPTSSLTSKETTVSADKVRPLNNPAFTTVADYQNWLKTGNEYADRHATLMNTMSSNGTIRYKQPDLAALAAQKYLVQAIVVYSDSVYYEAEYHYRDENEQGKVAQATFWIPDSNLEHFQESYDKSKQAYEDGDQDRQVFLAVIDDIEYYYHVSYGTEEQYGRWLFYWKENDCIHKAVFDNPELSVDQILPLVKLQQVTINPDHVTQ